MLLVVLLVYRSDVLVLQFSHERRDRRRREYVMIEENHDSIMGILAPISEDNQKAFSLASKVEVGCTFTFRNIWYCITCSTLIIHVLIPFSLYPLHLPPLVFHMSASV